MIAIIDYGQPQPMQLINVLKNLQIPFMYTGSEFELVKADKVIFAAKGDDPEQLIKELHLQNLYSLMRICKKTFLSVGLGLTICAENIEGTPLAGTGLINCNAVKLPKPIVGELEITVKDNNYLFNGTSQNSFYFNTNYLVPVCQNSTSFIVVNGVEYTASIEYNNFTGVQFFPCMSEAPGVTMLLNWYNK